MSRDTSQFHISGEEIRNRVGYAELIEALDQMHREEPANLGDLLLSEKGEGGTTNHFLIRAGWQRGRALGLIRRRWMVIVAVPQDVRRRR